MADITLGDYAGYIYLELLRARKMADDYSKVVGQEYAKDPVLSHFSVPRFKTPKLTLTVPVLVSGARFRQTLVFDMTEEKFTNYISARLSQVMATTRQGDTTVVPIVRPIVRPMVVSPVVLPTTGVPRALIAAPAPTATQPAAALPKELGQLVRDFYLDLKNNPDPGQPVGIVQENWGPIFAKSLELAGLMQAYKQQFPKNELFKPSLDDVLRTVQTATVVSSTTIDSLLVNPETQVVKEGSSDATVFTIQAEVVEDGFFIRWVKDEKTGEVRPVVEFD